MASRRKVAAEEPRERLVPADREEALSRSRRTPGMMKVESRARSRALQALYAWDMRPGQDLARVAGQVWDDLAVAPEERERAGWLIHHLLVDRAAVDRELVEVTANWRLERLGAIERSVLRLAAAELRHGETPPKVVIQEAVRLAERYGSEQSARFVNGVVDALARRMGLLEGRRPSRRPSRRAR